MSSYPQFYETELLLSASEVNRHENRRSRSVPTDIYFGRICCRLRQGDKQVLWSCDLKTPKLYIASINNKPIYVGITKQSIRNRLRLGWSATGEGGYHGYAWRHGNKSASLDVWCHVDALNRNERDIETVEAEVVFLIRSAGQWPEFQTEIHFYPSLRHHRDVAAGIVAHYKI